MRCMYVNCDVEAEYALSMGQDNIYLCKNHFSKLANILKRIALYYGSASLSDIDLRKERGKVRFISKKKIRGLKGAR